MKTPALKGKKLETQQESLDVQFSQSLNYGLAIYKEQLQGELVNTYKKSTVGFGLSIGHKLSDSWYGAIALRMNGWEYRPSLLATTQSDELETAHPIFVLSRIDYAPPIWIQDNFSIRPFISGGLGVLWFREKFYKLLRVSKEEGQENSEPAVQLAVGTRLQFAPWLQFRMSLEWWSGVRTSRYNGYLWYVEILTGHL